MLRHLLALALLSTSSAMLMANTDVGKASASRDASALLWGCVIESEDWDEYMPEWGIYAFDTTTGSSTMLTQSWSMNTNAGGFFADGIFYSVNTQKLWGNTMTKLSKFDIDSWEEDYLNSKGSDNMVMAATALVYDSTDKHVYGCYHNYDEDGYELGIGDYAEFTRTTICAIEEPLVAMAASGDGVIYTLDAAGVLSTMNKETGELTRVGSTGLTLQSKIQGCTYDPASGAILLAAVLDDNTSALFSIDPSDATTEKLTDLAGNAYITVLSLPIEPAAETPAAVSEIFLDFPKGAATGTISFTIPEKTYAGGDLTGEVSYTILANGMEIASGTASPGEKVEKTATLEQGRVKVSVSLANESGQSRKTIVESYIGFAYPANPSGITYNFNAETNKVKLTWDKVTTVWDEGYFSPEDIRYNVTRMPDGVVIAEDLVEPECEDTLPYGPWTGYMYAISSVNGTVKSEPGYSKWIALGEPVELPYYQDFSTEEGFGQFSQINCSDENNNDSWSYMPYRGGVVFYPYTADADNWLLAPAMELKKDLIYVLTFTCKADYIYNGSKECIEIGYGEGNDPKDYVILMEPTDVDWSDSKEIRLALTPEEDGVYRIGFHALSKLNMRGLVLCGMSVENGVASGAPAAPEDFTVTPGEKGAISATLSLTLPQTTISGDRLGSITSLEFFRDGKVCAELSEGLLPGEKVTLADELPGLSVGSHTYSVMAYNEEGCGQAALAKVFIGPDAPGEVRNLRFVDNFDGTAYLRWDAPGEVGMNGGYCPPGNFKYTVLVENEFGQLTEELDYAGNEVLITDITQEGRQRLITGVVSASNEYGEGNSAMQWAPLYGAPYTLPFEELLTDGFTTYDCWRSTEMNGAQFAKMMIIGGTMGVDESFFQYDAKVGGDYSILSSGKISLAGAVKPELSFEIFETPGAEMELETILDLATEENASVGTIDYRNLDGTAREWKKYTYDLTPYINYPYVTLNFKGTIYVVGESISIRKVKVMDTGTGSVINVGDTENPYLIMYLPGAIKIDGAEGLQIDLYNLSGIQVCHRIASESETLEVDPGYYILRIGGSTYKVLVK